MATTGEDGSGRGRRHRARLLGPALLLALGAACADDVRGADGGRGVLLVAIDGLRADHVGALGYDRPTTPALDALAQEGRAFAQAFTAAPRTRPAHIGLLTGCDPTIGFRKLPLEVGPRRWRVPEAAPRLAVEFLAAGYHTAAFLDAEELDGSHGLDRGFQKYVLAEERDFPRGEHTRGQIQRLLTWIRGRPRSGSWFAYLHLFDLERSWSRPLPASETYFRARPEMKEVPPVGNSDAVFFAVPYSRWRGGSRTLGEYEASYDGHLRKLDEELGDLFASLRRMGQDETTTIAVVGTHGVQLGEAGLILQSGAFSLADLHVPWILRPRRDVAPGSRRGVPIDAVSSLIDVAPTLLEIEGIPVPRGTHGRSRLSVFREAADADPGRRVFASCGLMGGGAVIGERHVFELALPDQIEDAGFRRSWFGGALAETSEPILRFYDRFETPFPPLDAAPRDPDDPTLQAYRQAAAAWALDVRDARRVLQGENFERDIDAARITELQDQGFIGELP
jgi:arylsulfatase A-like enzyme